MESRKQIDKIEELFNLGNTLKQQGKIDKAIQIFASIKREDSPEVFAQAQFNLGVIFDEQGEIDKAIQAWERIKREDSSEVFAQAQFNLGVAYDDNGDVGMTIQAWERIKREDSPEVFSQAQFNLGVTFDEQGEIDKAIQIFASIKREDSPEVFAQAQFNLAMIFYEKDDVEKAIQIWASIKREDSSEVFAQAQFNLAVTFDEQGEVDKAIQAWRTIRIEDSNEAFAIAQYSLVYCFLKQKKLENAISFWKKFKEENSIKVSSDDGLYFIANLVFENILPIILKEGKYTTSASSFLLGLEQDYRCKIFYEILKLESTDRNRSLEIFKYVNDILDKIKVSRFDSEDFEKGIAHYTTYQVGFDLLGDKKSKFRLNTIKGVNDPEEGKVLHKYLGGNLYDDERLIPFVSCFTFNHDSLNQFRLYGKDSGKEASGISLVISRDVFFDQKSNMYSSSISSSFTHIEKKDSINVEYVKTNKVDENFIYKLPLYRCIYIEPQKENSELYLCVSHRDELTFYRDSGSNNATERWGKYNSQIQDIEVAVREDLENIRTTFAKIKSDNGRRIATEIMLPLRYLIKHSAFREEQECRIVYISDICDRKIQVNGEHNQMYIEYGLTLTGVIYKIYLSPGAEKYKDYFRKILFDKEGKKVVSSTNPFRIK